MAEHFDTVIIGAGQAGLAIGYYLSQMGRDYIILEKAASITPAWRSRWDSFTLVLPNWTLQMPENPYNGDDPDGFLSRDEMVKYMEEFAATYDPKIRFGSRVTSIEENSEEDNYLVQTEETIYEAENVVVATGVYQEPKIPSFSKNISAEITQLHTSEYSNPEGLPEGAVLVVGTGQSGCQIAEELYQSGRKVYLCVGSAKRLPRLYRGKDSIWWLNKLHFFDQTVDTLPSPKDRFVANPFLSGKNGGHTLNLHKFAREGVVLLGRLKDAKGTSIYLSPDLKENLSKIDDFVADLKQKIDQYIEKNDLDAEPIPNRDALRDGYDAEIFDELDLSVEGIRTIVWATGYKFDFSWIELPVTDEYGYPIQTRGISEFPGLYFLGQHFLWRRRSGLPWGVGEDAAYIAEDIVRRTEEIPA
ncbi:MAG: NAD(P)-binding domain-containing protein [Anaerolineales bacterium]